MHSFHLSLYMCITFNSPFSLGTRRPILRVYCSRRSVHPYKCLLSAFSNSQYQCFTVDGHIVLESVQYRGQHVGVLPDGTVKEPRRTGTRNHAQFILHMHKSVKVSFRDLRSFTVILL